MAPPHRPRAATRFGAVLTIALAACIAAGAAHAQQPTEWVRDELLVGFRAGVGPPARAAVYSSLGATFIEDIGQGTRIVRLSVPPQALDALLQAMQRRPQVKFVEKNYVFDPALWPNDPMVGAQWHLPTIDAPGAWDVTQGAAGAPLAVLDSGIDAYHPEFTGKLLAGTNTRSNNTDTSDPTGHGTEVAGAAAATSNNGQGIAGMAGAAPILPVRVTDNRGRATSASIAGGITWATDHGARVANVSFSNIAGNATIGTAAQYAAGLGTLVVAAAGNCGCVDPTPDSPYILSVSATDEADGITSSSSTGPYVDLSAPGNNILTTERFGNYGTVSGTSLASPVVAGVAALMFAAKPALTPPQATQLLKATAVDLGSAGYDPVFGHGRVNANAAVVAAAGYTPPPDTTPPSVQLTAPRDGDTVADTVVVNVTANDDVGVVKVDLLIDGALFATDTFTPYSFAWDTTAVGNGAHTLQAVASDAANNTAGTTPITVMVSNVTNHAPVAVNDSLSAPYWKNGSYSAQVFDVLANDSDVDGNLDPGSVAIVAAPNKGGTVTVNANGTVSYTPKRRYSGTETFSYNVRDSAGATSNTATVTVTVQ
jgi:subtilisin family serine protease